MSKRNIAAKSLAALTAACILLSGCNKIEPDQTLVTIEKGEDTISLGYGNFFARYNQATYDQYYIGYFGDSYWTQDMAGDGKTMLQTTKKELLEKMEEQYLCKKHAEDYKIELSDDQNKKIEKAAKAFMKENEKDAIKEMGATEEYVKEMLTYETYQKMVSDKVKEEADVKVSDKEANQSTVKYVKFATVGETDENGNTAEVSEEDIAKAKENAENVAKAEDFDAAVSDAGGEVQTASFTAADKAADAASDAGLDESVIKAAKKLEDGQVSDVIEVENDGYYVVKMDKTLDEEATATKKESLEDEKRSEVYDDTLNEWKAKIGWVVDKKAWKKVQFDTLFKVAAEDTEEE